MSNPRFDNNCDIKEDFIATIKSPRLRYYDNLVLHIPHAGISGFLSLALNYISSTTDSPISVRVYYLSLALNYISSTTGFR